MQEILNIGFMYLKILILVVGPLMGMIVGMWYVVKWCQKHVKGVLLQWGYPLMIGFILAAPLLLTWLYIITEKGWIYVH